MSDKSAVQITVRFRQPLWYSTIFEMTISNMSSYRHTISVDGGFKSAEVSFEAQSYEIDDWLESGLGRQVEVFGPAGEKIWEGFVNEINAAIGTLNVTRGPLLNIANRVSVVYTPYLDLCADPPTTGTTTETTIAEDDDSQDRYGILEAIVNGGTVCDDMTNCTCDPDDPCVPDNEAEAIRDAYLMENKRPEIKESLSVEQSNNPRLTINCAGWFEFFNKYVYNSDNENLVQLPYKLIDIVQADPNSVFSTNINYIATDAVYLWLVPAYEDQNKMAWAVIQEILALGDANDGRTILGVYEDRIVHFEGVRTTVEYVHRVMGRDVTIELPNGTRVDPWNVRPGRWIRLSDFMIGRVAPTTLRDDPRNMFIESLDYTLPFGLTLQGGKIERVKQLMAKYGAASA